MPLLITAIGNFNLRPILIHLDLQCPLKKYLSGRSHELLHRKWWKLVSLASERVEVFSKIYPELFVTQWIEKVLKVISCNLPPEEAGNSSG